MPTTPIERCSRMVIDEIYARYETEASIKYPDKYDTEHRRPDDAYLYSIATTHTIPNRRYTEKPPKFSMEQMKYAVERFGICRTPK